MIAGSYKEPVAIVARGAYCGHLAGVLAHGARRVAELLASGRHALAVEKAPRWLPRVQSDFAQGPLV